MDKNLLFKLCMKPVLIRIVDNDRAEVLCELTADLMMYLHKTTNELYVDHNGMYVKLILQPDDGELQLWIDV